MGIRRTSSVLALAVAMAALLAACTQGPSTPGATPPTPSTSVDADRVAPADVMFVQMMIPHHEQAIEMSELLLAKVGMPAELRELAQQIADEQGPEIELMRSWLREWGVPEIDHMDDRGDGHAGHGPMGGRGGMDGMLSQAELDELRDAEGERAVELFLRQMIAHHEGAIAMAQDVVDRGRHPDVRALVDSIVSSQRAEIAYMEELLQR